MASSGEVRKAIGLFERIGRWFGGAEEAGIVSRKTYRVPSFFYEERAPGITVFTNRRLDMADEADRAIAVKMAQKRLNERLGRPEDSVLGANRSIGSSLGLALTNPYVRYGAVAAGSALATAGVVSALHNRRHGTRNYELYSH